jgi:phospholipid/cholesterol/gamma-HCH transport system substrate-binding protein
MRSATGRVAAAAALVIGVIAVAVVLLAGRGQDYQVDLLFQNASQLVKGNLVQVSGTQVGTVKDITLSDDGQAKIRVTINDKYGPLRQGTRAIVRASSLSGIANRYIDLQLGPGSNRTIPDGGTLDAQHTTTAVDLDEVFNAFDPKTRAGLRGVIRGFGATYEGRARQVDTAMAYLNPSLAASSRLFSELTFDQPELRRFVRESARLVTDIDTRREDLAGLVTNLAQTTGAIDNRRADLADAINRLPAFMRRANTTFVNLRAALDDVEPLVRESKPVAKKLRPFLAELRPLARDARPTVRDLARLVRKAGAGNDLIELTKSAIPVRDIAVGTVNENGKAREGAFPASTKALTASQPLLAFARPYAVDLTAWFDDFSHSGYYDALGGVGRVALNVNAFTIANGLPLGLIPPDQRAATFGAAQTHQVDRCPGSIERDRGDGSTPYVPPNITCDRSQVPIGP